MGTAFVLAVAFVGTVQETPSSAATNESEWVMRDRTTPLVIAHRGNSRFAPENTLVAFREALEIGADGVEMDLRISRDGVVVLMHDATVNRTTNGQGAVAEMTVGELKALDAGSWKAPRYAGEKIPTFEEVARWAQGQDVLLLLDLKVDGLGKPLADIVQGFGIAHQIIACCWRSEQVEDMRRHLPSVPIVLLGSAPRSFDPATYFPPLAQQGVRGFSFHFPSLTPPFIRAAHLRAMPVYAWTINDPKQMEIAMRYGVDGILTDDPSTLLAVIARVRKRLFTEE